MKNLDIDKFKIHFEKTLSILSASEKVRFYYRINKAIQEHSELNRVKIIQFPFEKIKYQHIIDRTYFKQKKIIYHGTIDSNDGKKYTFSATSETMLSASELLSLADKNKRPLNLTELEWTVRRTNKAIRDSLLRKMKESVYIPYNLDKREYLAEFNYFYHRKIVPTFNSKKTMIFFKGKQKKITNMLVLKRAYALSGKSLSFYNDVVNLFNKNKEEEVCDLIDNYPMIFPLFSTGLNLASHEMSPLEKFQKERNQSLTLVESVKEYFNLSDIDMEMIKSSSWQKFSMLKNRPLVFIDLIKKGLNPNNIKNKKEAHSVYLFYYYLECSNRFLFKNVDYNIIKDLAITKKTISRLKSITDTAKHNEKENRFFIGSSFVKKIKIDDPQKFILRIQNMFSNVTFLKNSFTFKNLHFNKKESHDSGLEIIYTVNNGEEYIIKIEGLTENKIFTKIEKTLDKGSIDLSCDLTDQIAIDYSRLFNKRYIKLNLINRRALCLYSLKWLNRKNEKKFFNVCVYIEESSINYKDENSNTIEKKSFHTINNYFSEEKTDGEINLLDIV